MRRAINSRFPQYELLKSVDFLRLLKDFDINFNGGNFNPQLLEYYDRYNIIKPIMRINRRLSNKPNQKKYSPYTLDNIVIRDDYLCHGQVRFPEEEEVFQEWSDYKDGSEERTILCYHRAQFMSFEDLRLRSALTVTPFDIENMSQDPRGFATGWQQGLEDVIRTSRDTYRRYWIRRIGLLILLEEAYAPLARKFRTPLTTGKSGSFSENWEKWRVQEFSAERLLEIIKMTIPEVQEFYDSLVSTRGFNNDPLKHWFVFQQYIKDSKLAKLRLQALRAQEYYRWARMVNEFIYDLTKRPMPAPDELNNPTLKDDLYAENFNYLNSEHRKRVLNDFLEEQLPQMEIAVEGDTEVYVINAILRARNVKPDREGLIILNTTGSNMERRIEGYIHTAKEHDIRFFVIADNDKKDIVDRWMSTGIIRRRMTKVWKDDFESDNFGKRKVLKVVNAALSNASFMGITLKDIKAKTEEAMRKNRKISFMRALELANCKKNKCDVYSIISKKEIARSLIEKRLTEIAKEYQSDEWKTPMPIERVIKRILTKLMPPRSY